MKRPVDRSKYAYSPWEDIEEDCSKTSHDFLDQDGGRITFDYSPYSCPSKETVSKWFELGCPNRLEVGGMLGERACGTITKDQIDRAFALYR